LKNLFAGSSQLKAVEEHSKNLSVIAAIGADGIGQDKKWNNTRHQLDK
jgi:hypothetical protein